MKRIMPVFLAIACCLWIGQAPARAEITPPAVGEPLPVITLPVPERTALRDYLGLSGGGHFEVAQVKAPVILVEIFSMYCPHCQRDAPEVDRLYHIIEKSPGLKGKIKILGIGAGNSPFEVGVFRKKYEVPFPLFSDGDFSIHKSLGEVRTPYFIGAKTVHQGRPLVFFSRLGGVDKADEFLKLILNLSGIERGK